MRIDLNQELEKDLREAKLQKLNTEFYVKLQFGLGDEEFERILFAEFFDSEGNVRVK